MAANLDNSREFKIALIPGDGIGPEVVAAAHQVIEQALTGRTTSINFIHLDAGWETFQRAGAALPKETLNSLFDCDGAIFGAVSSPSHKVDGYSSPIIEMRRKLDLYANLRPIQSAPLESSWSDVDMLIVRENTEGLYVKQERLEDEGNRAIADRIITRHASQRIVQIAFEQATRRAKQSGSLVTIVHKANVLRVTDGLFREAALSIAEQHPAIPYEEQLVDSMAYRMIIEPERYDVVVAPNLYGDILSDAAAALVGGLGLIPSANVGDNFVLAEPVHGSAPDIAGQGIANPIAAIRAGALLLEMLGAVEAAGQIQQAVTDTLAEGPRTKDLGGNASTEDVTDAILARMG